MPSKKDNDKDLWGKVDTAEFHLTSRGIEVAVFRPPGKFIARINGIDWGDFKYAGHGYFPGLPRRLAILYKDGDILGEVEAEYIIIGPDLKTHHSPAPGGGRIIYRGWWGRG
jgi:hypothetical protein